MSTGQGDSATTGEGSRKAPTNHESNVGGMPDTEANVYKVGVKIPPFWPEEPALWFAQIEGQFMITGITSDTTRFYHVIAHLDQQYASEVKDIITSPPLDNTKYIKLKTELIKRLSASQVNKIKKLLSNEELGDRTPSQFLRHLRTLAGPIVHEDFLSHLWSSRLPQNVQTIIATQRNVPLETIAELADRVYEIAAPTPVIASAEFNFNSMAKQIAELTKEVSSLKGQLRNSRSQTRDEGRRHFNRRSRSRSKSQNPDFCWYHNRFANRAHKCISPCKFNTSENSNGSRN